jgi:hypothetical protein
MLASGSPTWLGPSGGLGASEQLSRPTQVETLS